MNTEFNQNIIFAHIAGLTEQSKEDLYIFLKKSSLKNYIEIIDVDIITNKIIGDTNMEILFSKFEYHSTRAKDKNLSQVETKSSLNKSKNLEKKMFQYWKVKMEYFINKISNKSKKKILLIGYLSFFKNHRININLNIISKFFIKVDYDQHAKSIIKYNLENSKEDIINGDFDLEYLNIDFLVKKRIQLQTIYTKINYVVLNLTSIINILEIIIQTDIPNTLYYASFIKYDKKIPILQNTIFVYTEEWLALSSILSSNDNLNKINDVSTNVEKGLNKNGNLYLKLSKDQIRKFNNIGYLYEIVNTEIFLPFPTKNNIYKYFTVKPIKINRVLEINNIYNQIRQFNIDILTI
jgi:hypothetical protein